MPILAIDAALSACSAAVVTEGRILARHVAPMSRGHAEALIPIVDRVMTQAELRFTDLDAVGVTVGPGSFTGVRIGLAAARGFMVVAGRPVIGVTTFRAIERSVVRHERPPGTLLIAIDSKRRDVYAQAYDRTGTIVLKGCVERPAGLPDRLNRREPVTVAGDGASLVVSALSAAGFDVRESAVDAVDPVEVGLAALAELRTGAPNRAPQPLYLRAAEAKPLSG